MSSPAAALLKHARCRRDARPSEGRVERTADASLHSTATRGPRDREERRDGRDPARRRAHRRRLDQDGFERHQRLPARARSDPRARVLSAIAELDYRPNLSARGLRSGKTGVIGLAIPELRQNYFAELADAIIRAAETPQGRRSSIDQTGATREGEIAVLSGERLRLTDGILFSPERLGQEDIELLEVAFPLVLLGERMFGGPTDHVTMHNVESARAATEHLHRDRPTAHRRDRSPPDPSGRHPVGEPPHPRVPRGARRRRASPTTRRSCGSPPRGTARTAPRRCAACSTTSVEFDAVFTFNDTLGLGALRALGEAGIRVPEDVAVIGLRQHRRGPVLGAVDVERRPGSRPDRRGRRRPAPRAHQREGRTAGAAAGARRLPCRRSRVHRLRAAARTCLRSDPGGGRLARRASGCRGIRPSRAPDAAASPAQAIPAA